MAVRNLLIITQKVDQEDDLLGFFVDWIIEFSKHFEEVNVITLAKGNCDLPSNVHVHSLGKEKNSSRVFRFFKFYKLLFSLVLKSSGVFAHMSPIFVIASWPVAFIFRKKIIFWYLHRSVTLRLKIAEKLCYKIVTAARESLKFRSHKIVETGHGIGIDKFRTQRSWSHDGKLRILSVGRISKIKNYETLIESARILKEKGLNFKIKIVGKPVMLKDDEYLENLKFKIQNSKLEEVVHLVGFIPYSKIVPYYKESDVVVGLTPGGGIDKAILEGMASGCITLTSNDVFKRYFDGYVKELIFDHNDADELAEKIKNIINSTPKQKEKVSGFLVSSVSEHHQLKNMIDKISTLYE